MLVRRREMRTLVSVHGHVHTCQRQTSSTAWQTVATWHRAVYDLHRTRGESLHDDTTIHSSSSSGSFSSGGVSSNSSIHV